jgi:hypothetical protein
MRVDVLIADWKAALSAEVPEEARERRLYGQAWDAYQEGDHGFGLWCWHECDRLTNNFGGNVREVTRVLGSGRYLGFSHRKVLALEVPIERIYRPRKGDMSTPRPDAFVLPHYQVLCVYFAQASAGDPKANALLQIALGELEDRRRADPFLRHFETFRDLWQRTGAGAAASTAAEAVPDEGPGLWRPRRRLTGPGSYAALLIRRRAGGAGGVPCRSGPTQATVAPGSTVGSGASSRTTGPGGSSSPPRRRPA